MYTYFISGHLDLTYPEWIIHYKSAIDAAIFEGASFIIGDARGADAHSQKYLYKCRVTVVCVCHMFAHPRHTEHGFILCGGFTSDDERDIYMTVHSKSDIAWVRPGRECSGTQRNLDRRRIPLAELLSPFTVTGDHSTDIHDPYRALKHQYRRTIPQAQVNRDCLEYPYQPEEDVL